MEQLSNSSQKTVTVIYRKGGKAHHAATGEYRRVLNIRSKLVTEEFSINLITDPHKGEIMEDGKLIYTYDLESTNDWRSSVLIKIKDINGETVEIDIVTVNLA